MKGILMSFSFILILEAVVAELAGVLFLHLMGAKVIRIVELFRFLGTTVANV